MSSQPSSSNKPLSLPVPKEYADKITAWFGPTNEPLDGPAFGFKNFNKGIDWAVPVGTPVSSVTGGTVIAVGDQGDGWGISVKVRLDDGRIVNYGHLSEAFVAPGDRVEPGYAIGKSGNTGKSTGPHLSFDVLDAKGNPLDPSDLLGFSAARDNRGDGVSVAGVPVAPTNPDTIKILRQQRESIIKQLNSPDLVGDPDSVDKYLEILSAIDKAIADYEAYGVIGYDDKAKDIIAQKILLGDLDIKKATQLFNEWNTKQTLALNAAANQLSSALDANAKQAEQIKNSYFTGDRYAYQPTYVPATFDAAYEKWLKKMEGAPTAAGVEVPEYPAEMPYTAAPAALPASSFPLPPSSVELPPNWVEKLKDFNPLDVASAQKKSAQKKNETPSPGGPFATPTPIPAPTPNPTSTPVPFMRAQGGKNLPPGPYIVGEDGPETVVTPDGQMLTVGQDGPQAMLANQGGFDVLPANVPPEQAFLYAKLKQLLAEDKANEPARQMAEAQERARDPQLREKVMAAIEKALSAHYATNPPLTPKLVGDGWTYDPYAMWRPLTGVGPDGLPLAQSQVQMAGPPGMQQGVDQPVQNIIRGNGGQP